MNNWLENTISGSISIWMFATSGSICAVARDAGIVTVNTLRAALAQPDPLLRSE